MAESATRSMEDRTVKRSLSFLNRRMDSILPPLSPGEVTYLYSTGRKVFGVIRCLMISALLMDHDEEIIYLDGCNSMNPYRLVRMCKRRGMRAEGLLHRIKVCRAFTAYQMSSIIEEDLGKVLDKASFLIVAGMQYMYQDKDMKYPEASALVERAVRHISALGRDRNLFILLMDSRRKGVREHTDLISSLSQRHIRISYRGMDTRLSDSLYGIKEYFRELPPFQTVLDEFR